MMGFITRFIPMGWLYLIAASAFAAMAGWTWVSHARMQAAQASARAETIRADANTAAYLTLAKLAATQNAAISNLEDMAKNREAAAKTALQEAQGASNAHRVRSTYYLGLKTPQNATCAAAKDLIDAYAKTRSIAAADGVR